MRDWKANKYLLIIALACLNIGIGVLAEDAQFIELYEKHGCNYTHCIDTRLGQFQTIISCGVVVSEDAINGVKCAHVTRQRDRYPVISSICQSLSYLNPDTNETVKTGNLISINSMTENNKTRDHFMNVTQDPNSNSLYYPYGYIGLRKSCRDCNFNWLDHEPLTFTNWYGNEPDTVTYDCAWMRMTSPYWGKWTDWSCSSMYSGICQFFPKGTPNFPEPTLPNRSGCKNGWWAFGGYCYKEFGLRVDDNGAMDTSAFKTYIAGNQSCNTEWQGARMAIMPTREHNAMVAGLLGPNFFGSDVWVGIYSWTTYDYFFSLDNTEKLTYSNWVYGKPNHLSNVDKCGSMKWRTESSYFGTTRLGEWENIHCTSRTLPYMCSHEQSSEFPMSSYQYPSVYSLPLVKCPAGWIPYHTSCYKLFTEEKTFDDASSYCMDQQPEGALVTNLLTLWDDYEMQFGRTFLRDDSLPNRNPNDLPKGLWIGLKYKDGNWPKWQWIDNWPLTRSNWAAEHPQINKFGPCAFFNNNGQFESTQCYDSRPFVCKAEFYDFTPEWDNSALGEPTGCDNGWTLVGMHCVRVFPEMLSYNDARNDCKLRKSNLVSIHSPNYNALVTDMFSNATIDSRGMWIGLSWKGENLGWQWEDSSEVSYSNWDNGEPNDYGGVAEDCTELHKSGFWNDNPCDTLYPYMCKAIADTEYCAMARTSTLKPCGFVGMTEEECMYEWHCCYDSYTEVAPGQHCFKPAAPINVGMAAGAAVAVTLVVIGIAVGGYFAVTKYGNPLSSASASFANPTTNA